MSDTEEQKIPKGSYPAGRRVRLPRGATQPIVVYVSGIEQTPGVDYNIVGNDIVFTRQILKELLTKKDWFVMFLGVIGRYHINETVDIEYTLDGKIELAPDMKIRPEPTSNIGPSGLP